jgi:hypothetical protein
VLRALGMQSTTKDDDGEITIDAGVIKEQQGKYNTNS